MQRSCWKGFHPLYRGTWFPTNILPSELTPVEVFPSAISRYLVSNGFSFLVERICHGYVSIRYIAVLGFQPIFCHLNSLLLKCFHPLYRGTWFPTLRERLIVDSPIKVSIRYIAVLGFQHRSSVRISSGHLAVSIRYIAVLGSQLKASGSIL